MALEITAAESILDEVECEAIVHNKTAQFRQHRHEPKSRPKAEIGQRFMVQNMGIPAHEYPGRSRLTYILVYMIAVFA